MYVQCEKKVEGYFTDIIREELNVKSVDFIEDASSLVSYIFKPQLRTVGPKFGKQLGEIRTALDALDSSAKATLDAEGKIVAAINETVEVDFTFDATGKSTLSATSFEGKRELGDAYGMKNGQAWGSTKEWYEHADAFVAACIGKKASEITGDFTAAGCTIAVDGFVAAVAKIG
jgi:hypothetical protein